MRKTEELGGFDRNKNARLRKGKCRSVGLVRRRDNESSFSRQAGGGAELYNMIRIRGAGRLGKKNQSAGHGVVLMPGTITLMMQHQSNPIRINLQNRMMIRIQRSQRCGSGQPHRR